MLQRQRGQALILVLILLAVGALVITPALNLAFTGLKSRMVYRADLMEQYAADGAQLYSLWRLANESGFAASLEPGVASPTYYIILNGIKAEYSVTAQAAESAPSGAPITSNKYKVTASVTPTNLPLPGSPTTFTYTIKLKLMYPPPPPDPVTQLEVQVPSRFSYVNGSNTGFLLLDTDGPSRGGAVGTGYRYTWDFGSGVSFNYWEEKTVTFQATTPTSGYPVEKTYPLTVKVTPSVPAGLTWSLAPVVVGNPAETGIPRIKVTKEVFPTIIPPGVPTLLTYTIRLKNESTVQGTWIDVKSLQDALPAGFGYPDSFYGTDTGFLTTDANGPTRTWVGDNNTRQQLEWDFQSAGFVTINAGETVTATFQVIGTVADSGSYYNEVWVNTQPATYNEYSWPTGSVTVPQYDIESSAGGTTLRVNAQISGGSHVIKSWQVE